MPASRRPLRSPARWPLVLLAFVVALALLTAAGCGGGGDEAAEEPAPAETAPSEDAADTAPAEEPADTGAAEEPAGEVETTAAPTENLLMGGSSFTGEPTEEPPVKIGLVTDVAGTLGGFGPTVVASAELVTELANQNGGIMGHPVELFVRDDQGDPANTANEMRSLIQGEDVQMFFGNVLSSALLAQVPLAQQFQVPVIAAAGADVQFVGQQASIYQGMVSASSQVDACGFAKFQGERHPEWQRIALLVSNFAYGQDHAVDYKSCLEEYAPDAEVVIEQTFELGNENFTPLITALLAEDPDFIMTSSFGTDLVRFYQQYRGAGGTAPFAAFMDLDSVIAIGNDVPEGLVYGYARGVYTELPEEAQPWIDAFEQMHGQKPADYAVTGIGGFLAYKAAVEKAGTFEPEAVMEAFRCLTYYEPRGWITIRTVNGQADVPDYFGALLPDEELGHPRFDPDDRGAVFASEVWPPDEEIQETVPDEAERSAEDCE